MVQVQFEVELLQRRTRHGVVGMRNQFIAQWCVLTTGVQVFIQGFTLFFFIIYICHYILLHLLLLVRAGFVWCVLWSQSLTGIKLLQFILHQFGLPIILLGSQRGILGSLRQIIWFNIIRLIVIFTLHILVPAQRRGCDHILPSRFGLLSQAHLTRLKCTVLTLDQIFLRHLRDPLLSGLRFLQLHVLDFDQEFFGEGWICELFRLVPLDARV